MFGELWFLAVMKQGELVYLMDSLFLRKSIAALRKKATDSSRLLIALIYGFMQE